MARATSAAEELAAAKARLAAAERQLDSARDAFDAEAARVAEEALRALVEARIAWVLSSSTDEQRGLACKALQGHFMADWAADQTGANEQVRRNLRRSAVLAASRSERDEGLLRLIRQFLDETGEFAGRRALEHALAESASRARAAIAAGDVDVHTLLEAIRKDDNTALLGASLGTAE